MKNQSSLALLSCVILMAIFSLTANAKDALNIGFLPESSCYDLEAEVQNKPHAKEANQRYWYLRTPPYIGYSKGEQTHAGDVTQCVIGYPKYNQKAAIVFLNNKLIELNPVKTTSVKSEVFQSKNNKLMLEILKVDAESTCLPDGESCCGQYSYATAILRYAGKTKRLQVVKYEGG